MTSVKGFFIASLVLFSLNACSNKDNTDHSTQWINLSTAPNGDSFFVDKSSIKNSDGLVQVWTLANLGAPGELGENSAKTAFLINCQTKEFAVQSGIDYSEKDGRGHVLRNFRASKKDLNFLLAAPETITDILVNYSCDNSR